MTHTKKIGAAGRFGSRYGRKLRDKISEIEIIQRKKQQCPYCLKSGVKRLSVGVWHCNKCGSKFAGKAYTPR